MGHYNGLLRECTRLDAVLTGVSVNGVWCHLPLAADRELRFPLLADLEPKGALAKTFGVYREQEAPVSARSS